MTILYVRSDRGDGHKKTETYLKPKTHTAAPYHAPVVGFFTMDTIQGHKTDRVEPVCLGQVLTLRARTING